MKSLESLKAYIKVNSLKSFIVLFIFISIAGKSYTQIERTVNIIAGEPTTSISVILGSCLGAESFADRVNGISGFTIETESVTVSNFGTIEVTIDIKADKSKPEGVYRASIDYIISLDLLGNNICINETVNLELILEGLPAPMFSASPTSGLSPLVVQFSDQSIGSNSWMWDFGDGGSSSEQNPQHTYEIEGIYDVRLFVMGPDGSDSLVKKEYIQVYNWEYETNSNITSSPAIGKDSTIYIGSWDNRLYAINPDGTEKWSYSTGDDIDNSSPTIDIDGTIYVGSDDNKLYSLYPDGTLKWSFLTGGNVNSSPAIGSDGTIYVGSKDDKFYAINPDGTLKWSFLTGGDVDSSPAIGSDGTIYVGSKDDKLYAFNPDGSEKWSFLTDGDVDSSPAIGSDGTIYVGSSDDKLYAINPDGTEKWSFLTGWNVDSSPAIGSDGTIYVGSSDEKLYAFNPDGSEKWSLLTGGDVKSSPAIGSDGTIYVGSSDDKLYAIPGNSLGLADSSWPKFGNNSQNTQNVEVLSSRAPFASFSASPISGVSPLVVIFEDKSLYGVTSLMWDFGDGGSSTEKSPQHTYEIEGIYDVRLIVIGPEGSDTLVKKGYIQVYNWDYKTLGNITSSPAIGKDSTIFIGSWDNKLHAINHDGSKKWSYTTSLDIDNSTPTIGVDGTIYVGSDNNKLYSIYPDGTLKWSFLTSGDVNSSPAIGSDSTIYVGSDDNKLYAINPDGTMKWSFLTNGDVDSSPAIGSNSTIYVGSDDNKLYAINPDGIMKWSFLTNGDVDSSPAIGSDGTIYVGSSDDKLYAINPDGTLKWSFLTNGDIDSSPAIGSDGNIYVGSTDDKLYAFSPDGSELWSFLTDGDVDSSPAIGSDGTIYVGSSDGKLYAFSPDGSELWSLLTSGDVDSSPAIGSDGTIYVGASDGKLYAVASDSPGLAKCQWPKFGHDNQNTRDINNNLFAYFAGRTTICSGESTMLTASGGTSYQWSSGQSTSAITVNPDTTSIYSVIITNDQGCTDSIAITVTVISNDLVAADITGVNTICSGQNTVLTASGGSDYQWNSGQSTSAITVNPETTSTYTVIVTNDQGCTDSKSITVTVNDLPDAVISGSNTICSGQSTVLTASGGSDYQWNSGQSTSAITINPGSTSNYTVTVTNDQGCTDSMSYPVTVNGLPDAVISGSNIICSGESTVLTASGGSVYRWNTGDTTQTITVMPLSNSEYVVTVTDPGGCNNSVSHSLQIDLLKSASIEIEANTLQVCEGEEIVISAFAENGGDSAIIQWVVNDIDLVETGDIFQSTQFQDGDIIECLLFSSETCLEENPVFSNSLVASVDTLPIVGFEFQDTVYVSEGTIPLLGGTPEGGSYSGDLVLDGNLILTEDNANTKTTISYLYSDENGCENIVTKEVYIDISTSTNNYHLNKAVSIYPNPTSGYLNITFKDWIGEANIVVFGLTGEKILEKRKLDVNQRNFILETHLFSAGSYILGIEGEIGTVWKRILVLR